MAAYTAVIGDARSIGAAAGATLFPAAAAVDRLNPQLATARLRGILNPHIASDAVGGLISADFTVPAEEAVRWRPFLRYGAAVWMFDGATPIFHGYAEQPVWTSTGDCKMNVSGPWVILGRARMREAWDLWDLSRFSRGIGAGENKAGQVNVNSDNTVTLSFANGTVLGISDRVSVDYLLFGETSGIADGKLITAFEFDISDAVGLTAARRFRVIGRDSPGGGTTADVLYDTGSTGASGVQGALNLNGSNQSGAWPSTKGYRCLRFQFVFTSSATITQDNYVTLDRIRVSTREGLFKPLSGGIVLATDTAAIARDVLATQNTLDLSIVGSLYVNQPSGIPPEFYTSAVLAGSPDSNSYSYVWGLDPSTGTGTAPNSGVGVTGFTILEWQSPADVIASLAAIDGSHVGFYLPYNGRGGYDPPGSDGAARGAGVTDVGSFWLTAPPQLYYQPFPDPTQNPDYTIHTQEGAVVEPATDSQPLISYLYTNYQTVKGRQQSVVVQDAAVANYAFGQGFMRVEDYTIQPSVGDNQTPTSQAAQYLKQRRLPVTTATVTIQNDGSERYPILKQGCPVPRLATIRPGSIQINGVATSGLNLSAGYATHVEWWGESDTGSEQVQLTLTQPPGQMNRQRAAGHLVNRIHRTRTGPFAGF